MVRASKLNKLKLPKEKEMFPLLSGFFTSPSIVRDLTTPSIGSPPLTVRFTMPFASGEFTFPSFTLIPLTYLASDSVLV
jgi:hypothetical protein